MPSLPKINPAWRTIRPVWRTPLSNPRASLTRQAVVREPALSGVEGASPHPKNSPATGYRLPAAQSLCLSTCELRPTNRCSSVPPLPCSLAPLVPALLFPCSLGPSVPAFPTTNHNSPITVFLTTNHYPLTTAFDPPPHTQAPTPPYPGTHPPINSDPPPHACV